MKQIVSHKRFNVDEGLSAEPYFKFSLCTYIVVRTGLPIRYANGIYIIMEEMPQNSNDCVTSTKSLFLFFTGTRCGHRYTYTLHYQHKNRAFLLHHRIGVLRWFICTKHPAVTHNACEQMASIPGIKPK